jgi:hypothetical protein
MDHERGNNRVIGWNCVFGTAGILVSVYLTRRVEALLRDVRRSQIDEKIGLLFRTAGEVQTWKRLSVDPKPITDRVLGMLGELSAAGRLVKSMDEFQKPMLLEGLRALIAAMKKEHFKKQAKPLERAETALMEMA